MPPPTMATSKTGAGAMRDRHQRENGAAYVFRAIVSVASIAPAGSDWGFAVLVLPGLTAKMCQAGDGEVCPGARVGGATVEVGGTAIPSAFRVTALAGAEFQRVCVRRDCC